MDLFGEETEEETKAAEEWVTTVKASSKKSVSFSLVTDSLLF